MKIGLNRKDYNLFIRDALLGCVVIGGQCRNNCIFCCLKAQLGVGRKNWTNYISLKDLESVVGMISKLYPDKLDRDGRGYFFFGEGGAFLSCESTLHPQYIELVKFINSKYPDATKICSTIGKFIKPEWYDTLRECKISYIVSVNTLDKDKRLEVMKSEDNREGLISFLKECPDLVNKIQLLYMGDLDILKKDIETLYSLDSSYEEKLIKFALPDYSKFHAEDAKNLFDKAYKTWFEANELLYSYHKEVQARVCRFDYFPDNVCKDLQLWKNDFDTAIDEVIRALGRKGINVKDVGFLFPESVWKYSEKYDYLNRIFVKNITFGGSYVVGGLLSKNDIMNAVNTHPVKYKYYAASKEISDTWGVDIAGNRIDEYGIDLTLD